LPDGSVLNERAIQKIRSGEQGWQYAAALLEKFGSEPASTNGREDWLRSWFHDHVPSRIRRVPLESTLLYLLCRLGHCLVIFSEFPGLFGGIAKIPRHGSAMAGCLLAPRMLHFMDARIRLILCS